MDDQHITTENNAITIKSAVDVIERAVCSEKRIIFAHTGPAQRMSLWKQLIQVAGVTKNSILENAPLDLTLMKLNIDHSKFLIIQGYLRDVYEINLTMEDIQLLSVKKIFELEEEFMGYNFVEHHGIHNFIANIGTDELLSTTEMLFMPTLFDGSFRYDSVDTSQTHLCIVPGVEGLHSRFDVLCERLKLPALLLQPGLDHPDETVSELAQRYVQVLLKKLEIKDKFYLLGYESGVLVALEMAAILEEFGLEGTVYCLGGSPTEVITHFQNNLGNYKTTQELEYAVLKHMYSLIAHEDPDILDTLCQNFSWREKINTCMDYVIARIPHSIQYTKQCIVLTYKRLASLLHYNPEPKMLRSQLISLRPQYSFKCTDSSLQNYSHQPIISYQLEAPLSCATQDLRCTSIINQHLDSDILKTYANKNICDTYLLIGDDKLVLA